MSAQATGATKRRTSLGVVTFSEVAGDPATLYTLQAHGFRPVNRVGSVADDDSRAIRKAIGHAWGVIAGNELYDEAVLAGLPGLRVIVRPGAGYDSIDIAAASANGILVSTTPGANAEAVADMTIGLMLACLRQIPAADQAIRLGRWRPESPVTRDLFRRTVGIVGLGRIGRAVASRLSGFECQLLGYDPVADLEFCEAHSIGLRRLDDLLADSDVVTLHVPLSEDTRGLIDQRRLMLMRPGSVLINTSRGAIVDEDALVAALLNGPLWSAGLDVFESEPIPPDHRLSTIPSAVLTGHIASYTDGAMKSLVEATVEALCDARDGRVPVGAINAKAVSVEG